MSPPPLTITDDQRTTRSRCRRHIARAIVGALMWIGSSAHLLSAEVPAPYLRPERATTDAAHQHALITKAQWERLDFADEFDLGTALFMESRYSEAALAYRLASGAASTTPDRVAALLAASQAISLANTGKDNQRAREAGELANAAQRLQPANPKIAFLRVARWSEAKDQLEVQVARSMLERANLKEVGQEVCEPMTVGVIIMCVGAAGMVGTYWAADNGWIDEPTKRKLVFSFLSVALGGLNTVAPPSGLASPAVLKLASMALAVVP